MSTQTFRLTDSGIDRLFKLHSHLDFTISELCKAALIKASKPCKDFEDVAHGDVRPFNRIMGHMLEEPRKWETSIKALRGFVRQYFPGLELTRNGLEHKTPDDNGPTILELPGINILDWYETRPDVIEAKEARVNKAKATRETKAKETAAILEAAIGNKDKVESLEQSRAKLTQERDNALELNSKMGVKNTELASDNARLVTERDNLLVERDNLLLELASVRKTLDDREKQVNKLTGQVNKLTAQVEKLKPVKKTG